MSRETKKAEQTAGSVVYCGPDVPGRAKQYTVYLNRKLPAPLKELTEENEDARALVVPLEQLPEVRRQFMAGDGPYYTLYQRMKAR